MVLSIGASAFFVKAAFLLKAALILSGASVALYAGAAQAQHRHYNLPQDIPAAEQRQLETQRHALYRMMLAQPENLQLQFAYAMLSARLGDLEGASATYEAMLIRQPQAARVRLELAATYFQLGAQASARAQFRQVLEDPATPESVKPQIRRYLSALDQKSGGASGWSGRFSLGAASHSNANGGISGDSIRIGNWILPVPSAGRAQADQRGFGGLELSYRSPFGEAGHAWQADLSAGFNSFAHLGQMSSKSLGLRFGPDLALPETILPKARLHATLGYDRLRVGGADYLQAYGAGLQLSYAQGDKAQISLRYDYRREDYQRNATYRAADLYDGHRNSLSVSYLRNLAPQWQLFSQARHEDYDASAAMHSFRETTLRLGLGHKFTPLLGEGAPWAVNVVLHGARRVNDAANPALSRDPQRGREWGLQVIQSVPLTDKTNMQLFGGLRELRSNYPTRAFRDRFAGISFSRSF